MSISRPHVKDEGVVLHKRKLLNEHVMVTVLGRTSGKISLIAKGLRNFTSKRSAHLQTGNVITFGYTKSESKGHYLTDVTLVSHLLEIKRNPEQLRLLYLVLFLFDAFLPNEVPDSYIYQFCKSCIVRISNMEVITLDDRYVMMNDMLSAHGYPTKQTFDDCRSSIEEIIGKKIPQGVL